MKKLKQYVSLFKNLKSNYVLTAHKQKLVKIKLIFFLIGLDKKLRFLLNTILTFVC